MSSICVRLQEVYDVSATNNTSTDLDTAEFIINATWLRRNPIYSVYYVMVRNQRSARLSVSTIFLVSVSKIYIFLVSVSVSNIFEFRVSVSLVETVSLQSQSRFLRLYLLSLGLGLEP